MSITPVSIGTVSDVLGGTNVVVPPIDYTSRDYTSLVNDMLTLIPSFLPEWTDRSAGDFGVVLLELFAYVGDILSFYTDRVANEAFIGTAQQRQSILNLAALLDYTPHGNVAATTFPSVQQPNGGIQFTISQPSASPVLIPQYTQVSTLLVGQPILFETMADLWIYGDGISTTLNATSNGQANQQFFLGDTTNTIPWPTYNFTGGAGNQTVTVAGTTWTLASGNSFVGVPGSGVGSTVYTVINGNTILFGNGTNGQIPANNAAIVITYQPAAPGNYSGTVAATHGQSNIGEGVGISDGTPNQQYTLFNTPVVDGSVQVFVDEGSGPQPWRYHQRLIDAFSSEAAYTLSVDANSIVTITFGDNLSGRIPAPASLISANYMVGGGSIGNVAPNSLTQLVTGIAQVISVTNPQATSGGADAETIDHIRVHAPLSITAINRAVTLDDYAALVLNLASVAKAAAISTAYNAVNLYIHPAGDFIADVNTLTSRVTGLAQQITNSGYTGYMDDKKMVGTSMVVLPPQYNKNGVLQTGYVPVNVTVSIQVLPQYHQSAIKSACIAAIQNLFTFKSVDFGSRITLSSVYHILMEVEGVDYVNVNVLARQEASPQIAADVICAAYEIPQANPLGINVNATGGVNY
jgi:hypothetical protein